MLRRWSLAQSHPRWPGQLEYTRVQLFRWRQQLCKREPTATAFNAVAIAHEPAIAALPSPSTSEQPGTVEIEFAAGGRMRITGSVDSATVSVLLRALAKNKRRR